MDYTKFEQIFNEEIFEKSKPKLLETIGKEPNRYIGLFRPTKPKGKLLQNLLQSHEIRMGNAFEVLIENYLRILGYEILQKNFPKERLNIDQHFKKGDKIYFVEQKIRDDHDSSKKRGQIDNFEKKLNLLGTIHNWKNLIGIFYFIDPDIKKNKKYYTEELKRMQKAYNIELHLQYGKELFQFLQGNDEIWDEILIFLKKWKDSIPELPEINFDLNAEETFDEIKDLKPNIFRKLFSNDEVFNQIIMTLFPEKKTLNLLKDYFYEKKAIPIYNTLYEELKKWLK
jgi:Holliday junction resolvase-like predicted endonuclease